MSELANSIRQMREMAKAWQTGAPHQQPQGAHLNAVCDAAEATLTVPEAPPQEEPVPADAEQPAAEAVAAEQPAEEPVAEESQP